MKKFENKTIFITGGLSGIGKSCAIAAAKEGANVVIADLKKQNSQEVVNEINNINKNVLYIECDVSNFSMVGSAIQRTISTFGSLDVALNNAGIGGEALKTGELSEEAWLKVIGVNLNGIFNCMKHELIQMSKQKQGVIVNMSSILGKVGFANSSHYVASKHGVIGLSQSAALEYAADGIRINVICPGFIETPLLEQAGVIDKTEAKRLIVGLHPMNRLGHSGEVANGFIFLVSQASSFITGTTLEIDGGYLAK